MKYHSRLFAFTSFLLALLFTLAWGPEALAQASYPSKRITIIVPFGPGGTVDLTSRIFADRLQAEWKQPVTVVNKPGGNTVPAVNEFMNADPDGYTILADNPPASSMLEIVAKGLSFDPLSSRKFLATVSQTPMMIITAADSPYKSMADVVADIKRDPSEMSWTSLGGAGAQDAVFRLLFKALNVDVAKTRPVALKGGAEAITMTAGGHIKVGVGAWSAVGPALNSKTVRVLAVTAPERFPSIPDVPTMAELGYPSVEVISWQGFSLPQNTPNEIADVWTKGLNDALADPEIKAKLLNIGVAPFFKKGEAMKAYISNEKAVMQDIFAR